MFFGDFLIYVSEYFDAIEFPVPQLELNRKSPVYKLVPTFHNGCRLMLYLSPPALFSNGIYISYIFIHLYIPNKPTACLKFNLLVAKRGRLSLSAKHTMNVSFGKWRRSRGAGEKKKRKEFCWKSDFLFYLCTWRRYFYFKWRKFEWNCITLAFTVRT